MATPTQDIARPRFHMRARFNQIKSDKAGRPIFDQIESVEIRLPGDRNQVFVTPVREKDRKRWPAEYEAFKKNGESAQSGTPLEQWPPMSTARVAELKASNIFSVEDFANIPDAALEKLGPQTRTERDAAKAFLAAAAGSAEQTALAAENDDLRRRIAALEALVQQPAETEVEKPIEECSAEELKAWIKKKTGEAPRGNPSLETLRERALEIATAPEAV